MHNRQIVGRCKGRDIKRCESIYSPDLPSPKACVQIGLRCAFGRLQEAWRRECTIVWLVLTSASLSERRWSLERVSSQFWAEGEHGCGRLAFTFQVPCRPIDLCYPRPARLFFLPSPALQRNGVSVLCLPSPLTCASLLLPPAQRATKASAPYPPHKASLPSRTFLESRQRAASVGRAHCVYPAAISLPRSPDHELRHPIHLTPDARFHCDGHSCTHLGRSYHRIRVLAPLARPRPLRHIVAAEVSQ